MTTSDEYLQLKEELAREKKLRDEILKQRKEQLRGDSISELTALKQHWVDEKRRATRVDEETIAKRKDAEIWIEAIDSVIQNPDVKSKTKSSKKRIPDYVLAYVEAVKKLNNPYPTLGMLEQASDISDSNWSTELKNPFFVMKLKLELHKRQNGKYSKKPETKAFWQEAEEHIVKAVEKIDAARRERKNIPFNENRRTKGTQLEPDVADPDVRESMEEDIEADFGEKKSSRRHEWIRGEEY